MRDFFDGLHKVHFVGVGGVSMSKLCAYTMSMGISCSGSDQKDSTVLKELKSLGVKIATDNGVELARQADLVVYSSAIMPNHPELKVAKNVCERKYYLARVADKFETVIAISGTHGKTTVASMLAWVMRSSGVKVTAHIGGDIVGVDNLNFVYGNECLVTEACEYSRSFLELSPDIGVILNVDYDHPDCYKDLADTYLAFSVFAEKSRTVIYNKDYEQNSSRSNKNNCEMVRYISFGTSENADYVIKNIRTKLGSIDFDVFYHSKTMGTFTVYTYNEINVLCATAMIAVASHYGIDKESIRIGLATFPGVVNRFQCLGTIKSGARLVRDYAHHPREIATVIKAGERLNHKRLITVFEPHTFSRTKALFDEFVSVLAKSDLVIILPTFKAREISTAGEDSITLYTMLCKVTDKAVYCAGYDEVNKYLKTNTDADDVVLAVGAGMTADKFEMA